MPQGFASAVSGVFGVFGSKYTHTRTHAHARAHTHELGAGDTEDIGDTGDSAHHGSWTLAPARGGTDLPLFRSVMEKYFRDSKPPPGGVGNFRSSRSAT